MFQREIAAWEKERNEKQATDSSAFIHHNQCGEPPEYQSGWVLY